MGEESLKCSLFVSDFAKRENRHDLTIASKLGKHTSSSDSCLCARNDLFKRARHRTKTHKVSDVGGTKFFALDIDSSKDAHPNPHRASAERVALPMLIRISSSIFVVFFFSILMYSNARDDDKSKETFRKL